MEERRIVSSGCEVETHPPRYQDFTKKELWRFIEEARSERDALLKDLYRMTEERNTALEELKFYKIMERKL